MTGWVRRLACAAGIAAVAAGLPSAGAWPAAAPAARAAAPLPAPGRFPWRLADGSAGAAGLAVWPLVRRAGAPQPAGSLNGGLLGVSFAGRDDGWAVGFACIPDCSTGREDTLIMHWNGRRWSRQPSPDPSPIEGLMSVSAVSGTDAWAAGVYATDPGVFRTLILHWNGSAWSRVASPDPSPDHQAGLNVISQVTATSARNAWAVGYYCARFCQGDGEVDRTLILHWDGTRWSVARSPDPGRQFSVLAGVAAVSAASAWAAGTYATAKGTTRPLILHWNGTRWAPAAITGPGQGTLNQTLNGITAASARNAWAVGYTCLPRCQNGVGPDRPLILRWNGTAWAPVPSPDPVARSSVLDAASAASAASAWAAGSLTTRTGHTVPLILRWNGRAWTRSPGLRHNADITLFSVAAIPTATDGRPAPAWAVGATCQPAPGCPQHPVILRWDGTSWTVTVG